MSVETIARVFYDHVNSRFLKYVQDGTESLLGTAAKLRSVAGDLINPATEGKQDDAITKLTSLDGKDYATQTTLASILSGLTAALDVALSTRASESTLATADGRLTTIDAVLDSIKDIDGIKKITDALPTGDNWIGKVKLGDGTNLADLVADGAVYRLLVASKIAKGASDLVGLDAIDTTSGQGRLKTTLYTPEGEAVAFGSVPANPESIQNDFVKTGGGTPSSDLLVDGSVTPVEFSYNADSTHDISIQEIRFTLASNSVTFGSGYFGAASGPLANGLLVQIVSNGNTGTLANLVQNESFVNFASPGGFTWVVSSKDMLSSAYLIGGGLKLYAGTSDKVLVTVRDDIDSAGVYLKCFVKGNLLA